jgi:phage baseplate assembly protein W
MNIDFPIHLDQRGRTAATGDDDHIRDLIEQVLFTGPGERVNRPDFGSGLLQLVFAPNSVQLVTAVEFTVQAALQQWLGEVIELDTVEVTGEDAVIRVVVSYRVRRTGQAGLARFARAV